MTWTRAAVTAACAARARAVLDRAGYTPAGVSSALGRGDGVLVARPELPVAHRWLEGDRSPRAALIRLFLLSEVVAAADAEAALGDGLEALAAAGLLREESGGLTGTVELVPHDELLIASDRRDAADERNVVPGLHRPSAALGTLTVRRPARRALDIGTGNGGLHEQRGGGGRVQVLPAEPHW